MGVDETLAEQLEQLDYYDDGSTNLLTVKEVSPGYRDGTVYVVYETPFGATHRETYDIPDGRDESNTFYQVLQYTGNNLSTNRDIEGERVPFGYNDGNFELAIPAVQPSLSERVQSSLKPTGHAQKYMMWTLYACGFILGPLFLPSIFYGMAFGGDNHDRADYFFLLLLGSLAWILALIVVAIVDASTFEILFGWHENGSPGGASLGWDN